MRAQKKEVARLLDRALQEILAELEDAKVEPDTWHVVQIFSSATYDDGVLVRMESVAQYESLREATAERFFRATTSKGVFAIMSGNEWKQGEEV